MFYREVVTAIFKDASKVKVRKVRINPNLVLCKPKPMTIDVIIRNSVSDSYDEAKAEWELKAVISEDSEDFSNVCVLCGNTELKTDFIIHNPSTQADLIVGSQCIIRFGVVKGNIDVESGQQILNNFVKLQKYTTQVRTLITSVMVEHPQAKDYKDFYENLKKVLEYKNLTEPSIDELGEICFGDKWDYHKQYLYKQERLRRLWYEPSSIKPIRLKSKKDRVFKEGSTWGGKKRTTAYIPGAARSKSFSPDKFED
ncbi:hypothetical protein D3C74_302060 [compost metagenome]